MRAFVEENFLYLHPDHTLRDDDDLLGLGLVDSLGFVELVDEVQTRYGVTVSDVEITEENFGSIDAIAAFVTRRRRGVTLAADLAGAADRHPQREALVAAGERLTYAEFGPRSSAARAGCERPGSAAATASPS